MPHSTSSFPFEWKVHEWARAFRGGDGFFAIVKEDGSLEVHAGENEWAGNRLVGHDKKDALARTAASWIFYDPFEWPEYAWLEWTNVPRATLEKLIGARLEKGDFAAFKHAEPLEELPESWSVMF